MESIPTKVIRVLLGALLLFAGLNKFFGFAPNPAHNAAATAFMMALVGTGYMMPLIAIVEIVCGAAFVAGRFVALAAIVLAPVAVNIVLFHGVLDPAGGAPGFFVGAATIYLLAVNFSKYQDLLMPR
jgi:putative oxidoreductase